MKFTVKDLVHIDIQDRISLALIEVVTDKLIHCRRLEDDKWFAFFSNNGSFKSTYNRVVRNFGQINIKEFSNKYPEFVLYP
jgi:hypothetical protein